MKVILNDCGLTIGKHATINLTPNETRKLYEKLKKFYGNDNINNHPGGDSDSRLQMDIQ